MLNLCYWYVKHLKLTAAIVYTRLDNLGGNFTFQLKKRGYEVKVK